jgi:hypothetical protein
MVYKIAQKSIEALSLKIRIQEEFEDLVHAVVYIAAKRIRHKMISAIHQHGNSEIALTLSQRAIIGKCNTVVFPTVIKPLADFIDSIGVFKIGDITYVPVFAYYPGTEDEHPLNWLSVPKASHVNAVFRVEHANLGGDIVYAVPNKVPADLAQQWLNTIGSVRNPGQPIAALAMPIVSGGVRQIAYAVYDTLFYQLALRLQQFTLNIDANNQGSAIQLVQLDNTNVRHSRAWATVELRDPELLLGSLFGFGVPVYGYRIAAFEENCATSRLYISLEQAIERKIFADLIRP